MHKIPPCCLGLFVASLLFLATSRGEANAVEVDWTFNGFSTTQITVNPGDEVDIVNMDDTFDLQVTGAPPESFSADVPASDGVDVYYVPYIYNNIGTFSFSDELGNSVTVVVTSGVVISSLSVAITSPADGAVFTAPANITITALPSGGATPYEEVDFYLGTNLEDFEFASPWSTTLSNVPAGNYTLSAVVYDNNFDIASNFISVSVVAPQPTSYTNYILPVKCSDIYPSVVDNGLYLDASSDDHGALEFAAFNSSLYSSILLEVNPYGLPLFSTNVNVYGLDNGTGSFSPSDYNSGILIGVWQIPPSLDYGQITTFDVTSFVKSAQGRYFGFILTADGGGDVFSSTAINYGTPPELFALSSSPVLPQPVVSATSGQFIVSWPTNNSAGLSLQASPSLGADASWSVVTPVMVGNQWVVTNSASGPSQFFKLVNQ